ncbi:MAG: DMT family transporter [Oscillospiraceae bacterium]|nr:DMT family transporter [Oscillospiraceae bacterium]
MSQNRAEALLAAVIIARATSLLIIKTSLGGIATFNLMALRFGIAFICLLPFARRELNGLRGSVLLRGALLGVVFFAFIAVELLGLRMTDSSALVAFLENTSIVLVPLAEALLRRRLPHRKKLLCAALALLGVGFLLLRGGRFELSEGAAVCMAAALLYTAYIIITDRLSHRDDPLLLGLVAVGTVGALSVAASVLLEAPRMPGTTREWVGILLLAVVCSSIGTALQPLAQRYVPSEKTCVFCALNPLATCVMGWLFLNEWQGVTGVAGAALILLSIVLSRETPPENTN